MEPPPYSCFFSPFTRVFPESTAAVFTTSSQSPPLDEHQDHVYSFNVRLAVLFVVYYCFNNTKGTDRDYLVIHITAGLVTLWSLEEGKLFLNCLYISEIYFPWYISENGSNFWKMAPDRLTQILKALFTQKVLQKSTERARDTHSYETLSSCLCCYF